VESFFTLLCVFYSSPRGVSSPYVSFLTLFLIFALHKLHFSPLTLLDYCCYLSFIVIMASSSPSLTSGTLPYLSGYHSPVLSDEDDSTSSWSEGDSEGSQILPPKRFRWMPRVKPPIVDLTPSLTGWSFQEEESLEAMCLMFRVYDKLAEFVHNHYRKMIGLDERFERLHLVIIIFILFSLPYPSGLCD